MLRRELLRGISTTSGGGANQQAANQQWANQQSAAKSPLKSAVSEHLTPSKSVHTPDNNKGPSRSARRSGRRTKRRTLPTRELLEKLLKAHIDLLKANIWLVRIMITRMVQQLAAMSVPSPNIMGTENTAPLGVPNDQTHARPDST